MALATGSCGPIVTGVDRRSRAEIEAGAGARQRLEARDLREATAAGDVDGLAAQPGGRGDLEPEAGPSQSPAAAHAWRGAEVEGPAASIDGVSAPVHEEQGGQEIQPGIDKSAGARPPPEDPEHQA